MRCNYDDQINRSEMDRLCSTYASREMCTYVLLIEQSTEKNKFRRRWEDYNKVDLIERDWGLMKTGSNLRIPEGVGNFFYQLRYC